MLRGRSELPYDWLDQSARVEINLAISREGASLHGREKEKEQGEGGAEREFRV